MGHRMSSAPSSISLTVRSSTPSHKTYFSRTVNLLDVLLTTQKEIFSGQKVNARHDLTLGLWHRDCEISREGFREGRDALRKFQARGCGRSQRHCRSREVPPQGSLEPNPLQEKPDGSGPRISATPRPIAEAPTPTSAFEGSTARAAMFPVRGSRKIPSPDRG